jgi:hypothetical protein
MRSRDLFEFLTGDGEIPQERMMNWSDYICDTHSAPWTESQRPKTTINQHRGNEYDCSAVWILVSATAEIKANNQSDGNLNDWRAVK